MTEQSTEIVDTAMRTLGGEVLRRPLNDLEAEVAAAEKAQRKAKREARKQLLEARHHRHEEETRANLEDLKAKLHLNKTAPASAA